MKKQLQLRIEVNVTAGSEQMFAPMVNDALRELVNLRAFRDGSLADGRVVAFSSDHCDVFTSIDMHRLVVQVP